MRLGGPGRGAIMMYSNSSIYFVYSDMDYLLAEGAELRRDSSVVDSYRIHIRKTMAVFFGNDTLIIKYLGQTGS